MKIKSSVFSLQANMVEVFIFFQTANYGNPSESLRDVVHSIFFVLASMSLNSAYGLTANSDLLIRGQSS